MPFMQQGGTRAALLIEVKEKDGNLKTLVYHLAIPLTIDMEEEYNTLDFAFADGASYIRPRSTKIRIEGYVGAPREYSPGMPQQRGIEPTHLAIESNESEIVIDPDDYEDWQRDDG